MSSQLSVAQVLASLEEQMRFHREREAEHATQEAFHRDQRAIHAAEYETVARHYEAFKASASAATEIAARLAPPAEQPTPTLKPQLPSRLVARAVYEMPADATFTPSRIAAEVNQRYPRELRKPIDSRLASTALRRLMAQGTVRLFQKGTAHREAVYARR